MSLVDTKYRYTIDNSTFALQLYDWENREYDYDDSWDMEVLAEKCAEDHFRNHDGWERRSWCDGNEPLLVYIWTSEDTKVGYEVYLEYEPSFSVTKIEE